jgi:hypothetical protein
MSINMRKFCITLLLLFQFSNLATAEKTDRAVYPEPPAPRLPPAGGTIIDPIFGTEIMRITDERNAEDGGTYYSYWPTFNCDNTQLLVKTGKDGSAQIFSFNPTTFTLGGHAPLPAGIGAEGAIWSAKDPDTLYGFKGMAIYAYHPTTKKHSLVADLTARLPRGDIPWQPSMSNDDDVFAFSRRRPNASGGSDYVGYVVYRRSDNSIVLDQTITTGDLDEVQLDKTGRWLVVKGETKTTKGFSIRDLKNGGQRKQLGAGPPDYAPGHSDNGSNFVAGFNNYLNTIDRRNFLDPTPMTAELKLANDWSQGLHISLLANDESWMLISLYPVNPSQTPAGIFHNEIILVKTDGSQTVRRLLHHHSIYKDYWDSPRANISRDGRFVAFTSNWGGRLRRDLFVARITQGAPVPSPNRPRRAGTTN